MIPTEIGFLAYKIQHFDPDFNEERMREQLDLFDKKMQEADIRTMVGKRKVEHSFNKRVRPRSFKVND